MNSLICPDASAMCARTRKSSHLLLEAIIECCCSSLVRSKDRGNAWEFEKTGAVDRISEGSGCTAVGRGHTITQALPQVLSSEQTEKIKSPT
jgi:hypothetical protein